MKIVETPAFLRGVYSVVVFHAPPLDRRQRQSTG